MKSYILLIIFVLKLSIFAFISAPHTTNIFSTLLTIFGLKFTFGSIAIHHLSHHIVSYHTVNHHIVIIFSILLSLFGLKSCPELDSLVFITLSIITVHCQYIQYFNDNIWIEVKIWIHW